LTIPKGIQEGEKGATEANRPLFEGTPLSSDEVPYDRT